MFRTNAQIRIGQVGGHQIYLDLIAFGLFALIVITRADPGESLRGPVAFLVAAFVMILVHELGHAAAIRKLTGQHTAIVLGFGGATLYQGTGRPTWQILISLAGPGAGFVLGAVGWCVAMWVSPIHDGWPPWSFYFGESAWLLALRWLILMCFIWGALNLVPAYPLDGGQALRALLMILGVAPPKARRFTRRLALGIAVLTAIGVLKSDGDRFLLIIAAWVFLANMDEARQEGW